MTNKVHALQASGDHTGQISSWATMSATDVTKKLQVNPDTGLSPQDVAQRLLRHGANILVEKPPTPVWRLFADQFTDFMIVVLLVAAVVSGLIGDIKDTLAIVVIILLNAVIGFSQEIRARNAIASLRKMAAISTVVMRNGERMSIPAPELVPGDIVMLEAGNVVPADLRLIEVVQLKIDEASLTGEATTVEKHAQALTNKNLALGDRLNMAFKGTTLSHGRGTGVVVATGMGTELGKIATLLDTSDDLKTPLQKRLSSFGKLLSLAVLAICIIVFTVGILRGETAVLMFLTAISLAVAAIPEALPAIVTISLALGARKMVQQHALIRRLPAVETLGSVTYICSDKTGTLTQNKMRVQQLFSHGITLSELTEAPKQEPWISLMRAMALSNDASISHKGKLSGDPTETALYQAALDAGYDKMALEKMAPRVFELPFEAQRKCMTTFHDQSGDLIAYTKGAPENVIAACVALLVPEVNTDTGSDNDSDSNATPAFNPDLILAQAQQMAEEGLRVLAVAQRIWSALPEGSNAAEIESELVFIGLIGLMDPPRREAKSAVALCISAGITPVMITGDHAATAGSIARQLGIAARDDIVMTGPALAALSDAQFKEQVARIRVYARVDPAQKIRIVEALQAQGEFVAMTGDGVNDAPALKRADIGIAMGKGGTDVAREASSLVLLDDNFASIVHAVREGRRIFDNIRKFIRYAMTGNSAEIWVIFLAPFLGLPIPLLPIHILWINLMTDGLPGLAFAAEPAEKGIMQRPPRPPQESIFAHGMWQHIVWVGLAIAGVSLFIQAWAIHDGSAHWQTMVFTVLTLAQMGHVLAIRSERDSLFKLGLRSNLPMLYAVILTFALQMATIYVPFLNPIFSTAPLTATELGICLLLSASILMIVELEKWMIRKGWLYKKVQK